jgi:hypothetical protein
MCVCVCFFFEGGGETVVISLTSSVVLYSYLLFLRHPKQGITDNQFINKTAWAGEAFALAIYVLSCVVQITEKVQELFIE